MSTENALIDLEAHVRRCEICQTARVPNCDEGRAREADLFKSITSRGVCEGAT